MSKIFSYKYIAQIAILVVLGALALVFVAVWGVWGQKTQGVGTNIDSGATTHWAWNDLIGWIDFYGSNSVMVSNASVSGFASSSVGEIVLDCSTPPSGGSLCGPSNFKVINDGSGNLSGFAWNDTIGWISFCGGLNTADCPGSQSYRVTISGATGDFGGYAWNDAVGWINFNCSPQGCPVTYKVKTSWLTTSSVGWLESATFDTGVAGGAQINSITWRGSQPAGVPGLRFQLAFSSSSAGPWSFGWDANGSTSPNIAVNTPTVIDYTLGANQRYFRYRFYIYSDLGHTTSSRVDDILVNWSR